jgi:hypothetical protein
MNEYDRRAIESLRREIGRPQSGLKRSIGRATGGLEKAGRKVVDNVPEAVTNATAAALRSMMAGVQAVTIDQAFRTVRREAVLRSFRRQGVAVDSLDDLRSLDLRVLDEALPSLRVAYSAGVAVEGALAGAAITGAQALAVAGTVASAGAAAAPGIGTVATAMAADAVTVLAASGRAIAHVGAYYGYDARLPEEQVFALSILSWSTATTDATKTLAFQQLSRLTQQLMRGGNWAQLGEHMLVRIVHELYTRLGIRLTQRSLGRAVPVAGILIGAGMNATLLQRVVNDAHRAYRVRHLTEKYGLSDDAFMSGSLPGPEAVDTASIDLDEIRREIEASPDPDPDGL